MASKSVNWIEGQFIHPHHFQQAFLELQEQMESVIADYVPHAFGISSLAFSESDCENCHFLISQIDCRFPSGARVNYPGNAMIESRSFTDQLDANKGYLEVFLGLPALSDEEPNCLRFDQTPRGGHKYRYLSHMAPFNDLVSGGNQREIEVKVYNPKILFSGESTYGYETIRIAAINRSSQFGAVPKPDREFVPPCISVSASDMLVHYQREIGNRLIAKNSRLRKYWKSKDTASLMRARDGFKVQTLAMASNIFSQLAATRRLHPFVLYGKIAEIIGLLSIYCTDDRYVTVPDYDHDKLGACFAAAHENMVQLLALLEESTFESRVFEINGELLTCAMEPQWFEDRYDVYICFEANLEESEVVDKVASLKVASENVIPILNKRRIRGMSLEGPLHHLSHMPSTKQHHYYKVPRDTTYFPKLQEHPSLALWGAHTFADLVTLYLVERGS